MPTSPKLAALLAAICVCAATPAAAICLESGEYEQAIADMEAREAARAKEAEARSHAEAPAGPAGSSETASPVHADTAAPAGSLPAEVAQRSAGSVKPN